MPDELIPGATSSTYILQPADVGRFIYCRVTATNVAGFASVDAAQVGPIAPIVIADVTPPTITSVATVTNVENTVLVHGLTANETVSWTIDGGTDAGRFEIVGSTLRWLGNGTKDFEAPNDSNLDNVYDVQVRATDGSGNISQQIVVVTVTDVVEAGLPTSPTLVVSPFIADTTPESGVPLGCDPGVWAGDAPITFHFEWHKVEVDTPPPVGATGTPVGLLLTITRP